MVKPPISVRRPIRPETGNISSETKARPIEPAAIPDINPDSAEAIAFTMRGRSAGADDAALPPFESPGRAKDTLSARSDPADLKNDAVTEPVVGPSSGQALLQQVNPTEPSFEEDHRPIAIKLPPDTGRKLAAVADRRGSKRTHVAIEVLTEPLRRLAEEHRAGRFPELPNVVAGSVRTSISFNLPRDLAEDLEYVLAKRRAVRAQVVTRLLVPAINKIYASEFGLPPT